MKDSLGDRMKDYENRARIYLPRRTYTIFRIDGKAFHTYTKMLDRPFDTRMIEAMKRTTIALCSNIQGAVLGYCQSDEITIIATDFEKFGTDTWFDNNIQKIASVSASIATRAFNRAMFDLMFDEFVETPNDYLNHEGISKIMDVVMKAEFDSRAWTIADKEEVLNALLWRQQDAEKNSISGYAQSMYSHKQLHKKNTKDMREMIFDKSQESAGVIKKWEDLPMEWKRGYLIGKVEKHAKLVEGKPVFVDSDDDSWEFTRSAWEPINNIMVSKDREHYHNLIPSMP